MLKILSITKTGMAVHNITTMTIYNCNIPYFIISLKVKMIIVHNIITRLH